LIAALLMLASGTRGVAEPDPTGRAGAYLKAHGDKAVGTVAARAYGDPARPTGAPEPYVSMAVTLVSYSAVFEAQLDAAKSGIRDSVDGYVKAVARVGTARVDYQTARW
jgi:hypothetical protein